MGKIWAVDAINLFSQQNWTRLTVPCRFLRDYIFKVSDVNIRADFVCKFHHVYSGRSPRGRFSNLRFGLTLTFKLIVGFLHKLT